MGFITYFHACLILLCTLIGISLVMFLRLKKKKSAVYMLFFSIFYIYLIAVLDYTLFQYQALVLLKHFAPNLILRGAEEGNNLNFIPLVTLTARDLKTSILNIVLFIPFGFGLPFISNFRLHEVVFLGLLCSIAIESLQLLSGLIAGISFRIADINDVILNTLGALAGYIAFIGFLYIYRKIWPTPANQIGRYIFERPQ